MTGFNGTILAYGQTSSGKTHTMEGPSLRDTVSQGISPRTIDLLFNCIRQADVTVVFTVSVSYFEIYNEKLRDLLNPLSDNMKIREKPEGFTIQDITEVYCTDKESVMRVIDTGKTHRASAPTLMNAESSRSHSLLSIYVHQRNEMTGRHRRGKLFLIDLAGSEKVSKTGAKGTRLEEAKNINRSLTTLGMVINALCDGSPHVPYRDSKLTRVLTDSLGGNSKTTLIICCAPELSHLPETLSTLRFGERAKRIKNNAKVNEELSVSELKQLLRNARREIQELKAQLAAAGLRVPTPSDSPATVSDSSGNPQLEAQTDGAAVQEVEPSLSALDLAEESTASAVASASSALVTLKLAKEDAEEEARNLSLRVTELTEEADAQRAK